MKRALAVGAVLVGLAMMLALMAWGEAKADPECAFGDPEILVSGWRGEVTFTKSYTNTIPGDSVVTLGTPTYPTRTLTYECSFCGGCMAVLTDTLDAGTFHFYPIGVTVTVTGGIDFLGEGWYAMAERPQPPLHKIYLPFVARQKVAPTIVMTGDVSKIILTKNFDERQYDPVKILWGIEGTPAKWVQWNGNRAELIPPEGAQTLWLGHSQIVVSTEFLPLGQDWYSIPLGN